MRKTLGAAAAALFMLAVCAPQANAADWKGSFDASYQAAQPSDTIVVPAGTYGNVVLAYRDLPACDPNDPAQLITFDLSANVAVTGNLEIHGPCVFIRGRATGTIGQWRQRTYTVQVNGYTSVEGDSATQFPHGVRIEGVHTGNLGAYSGDSVIVRDVEVGPRLLAPPCSFPENRIAANGASGHAPVGVLWERVVVHGQNRTQAAADQDCHYGGLQVWNGRDITIRDSVFERNVVYHLDVGEGGYGPTNLRLEGNSFSCPADNSWVGDVCDGQKAVQFDNPAAFASTTVLTGNVAANGPGGLYGCYSGNCSFAGMTVSGNKDLAESTSAPPLNGTPPPPPPPVCPGMTLALTKVGEDAATVTLAWQPVPGAAGYRFSSSAVPGKRSHTWDGSRSTVRFARVPAGGCYRVEALGVVADGGLGG